MSSFRIVKTEQASVVLLKNKSNKSNQSGMKKMTNKELALVLLQTVEQFGELPLQIVYEDVNLIGEKIRVELDQSCSKNSKAISIYTD